MAGHDFRDPACTQLTVQLTNRYLAFLRESNGAASVHQWRIRRARCQLHLRSFGSPQREHPRGVGVSIGATALVLVWEVRGVAVGRMLEGGQEGG